MGKKTLVRCIRGILSPVWAAVDAVHVAEETIDTAMDRVRASRLAYHPDVPSVLRRSSLIRSPERPATAILLFGGACFAKCFVTSFPVYPVLPKSTMSYVRECPSPFVAIVIVPAPPNEITRLFSLSVSVSVCLSLSLPLSLSLSLKDTHTHALYTVSYAGYLYLLCKYAATSMMPSLRAAAAAIFFRRRRPPHILLQRI